MPSIAQKTDWKTEKMPGKIQSLDFQRVFSSEEFDLIRRGLIPREMEDKWFIYYENSLLNIHRSWTGAHIYKIVIEHQEDGIYKVMQVIANRAEDQFNQKDNDYDILLVNYLIDRLLLGKNISFPVPAEVTTEEAALFKHSLVGHATPNIIDKIPEIKITFGQRLQGCLIGGAIGDALGSFYEGRANVESVEFEKLNGITDDTQLTLATCEAILGSRGVSPESIAKKMLEWYNNRKLSGLGASTLKALRDLQVGAHWGLSGRSGEYAAGNGAAMRIAPLVFFVNIETEKTLIRDVCNITHKNDEAYTGCLSILYALHYIITDQWFPNQSLLNLIASQLPDTSVRDNLLKLQENPTLSISEAAHLVGTSGHVIESVPFSIFAAQKIKEHNFEDIISEIILCGGDTDTNASLAGHIMGAFIGLPGFSAKALSTFRKTKECDYILQIGDELTEMLQDKVRQGTEKK
ncbi:ADP-ribosylglycohydrolase [Chitinophaga sp. CF118]|uniref:ADP-ribosylglycohydrolase family protein n=1 Tax=Chitinophaga sp. CF118 TaxID=1884367 RepID=UPI0008E47AE9|nr:ADP-ribosylglycohydrolase family protein [Chitinophaga sp. CF118]SFF11532.1 ADP-ribosylglycohydrolase [Chitinophaga sp. CF118]